MVPRWPYELYDTRRRWFGTYATFRRARSTRFFGRSRRDLASWLGVDGLMANEMSTVDSPLTLVPVVSRRHDEWFPFGVYGEFFLHVPVWFAKSKKIERIYWWRKSIKKNTTHSYAWYRKVKVSRQSASVSVWKCYPPSSSGFLGKVNQGKSLRANWWASNYYGLGFWTNEAPRECIRTCLWHPNCWSNCASNCHAVDELWTCWYRLWQWPPNSSFSKFLFPGNYSEGLQIPAVWQKIILPDGELLEKKFTTQMKHHPPHFLSSARNDLPNSLQSVTTALNVLTLKSTRQSRYRRSGSCTRSVLCIGVKWSRASAWTPYWSNVDLVRDSQQFLPGHHKAWSDQSDAMSI